MPTANDICTDALREIGVINAVDAPSGEDAALALNHLNRLLDNWNADRVAVYADVIETFTFTPSLNPHTIGPSGVWVRSARPESIDAANVLTSSGTRTPVAIRDKQWWMGLPVTTQAQDIPTDLYYERAWPNGKIYFFGIPSATNQLELISRVVLGALAKDDAFSLPPGYKDAITKTLAEDLVGPFQVALPQLLPMKAKDARARIFGANLDTPRLSTRDAGMPGGGRGTWDYRIGRSR